MNILEELQNEMLKRHRECEAKAKAVQHDDYLLGLLSGYASAYQLAAGEINVAILNLKVADADALVREMQGVQP